MQVQHQTRRHQIAKREGETNEMCFSIYFDSPVEFQWPKVETVAQRDF